MSSATKVVNNTQKPKDMSKRKRHKDYIFVAILLAYPVLQFVITWVFVNIGSLRLAFIRLDRAGNFAEFVWFDNFARVLRNLFTSPENNTGVSWLNNNLVVVLNSFGYAIVTIFISLPLSMLFSYFLDKKMPLANVFRVIFFLPNIIPVVALTMSFALPLKNIIGSDMFRSWPGGQMYVYLYCIWAGLGYNVVLLSGAIGRIPKEIYESAQLDGAGYFTEFTKITVPLVWPTVVTLVVVGLTNVLTLYLQPYLLTNGDDSWMTSTIAMEIFLGASGGKEVQYPQFAAKGLLFSVIWAPIVMLVRNRMSKKYDGIDF